MESEPRMGASSPASPVEIFSIGTELLIGRIQDTNSFWLAQQVSELGGTIGRITIVGDDAPTIVDALGDAVRRGTGTIMTTGGLGPTPDDLTVECVAQLVGVGTVVHAPALADYVRRRDLRSEDDLSPALRKMAVVPAGAEVFLNPAGLAPLIRLRHERTTFLLLPGPPAEVQAVFERYVRDHFGVAISGVRVARRVYVNMHEGELAPHAHEVMEAVPGTYIKGYIALANQQRLPVDVVVTGTDDAEAQAHLESAVGLLTRLITAVGRQVSG
jgi:nicotinamide-nucleotide amidase